MRSRTVLASLAVIALALAGCGSTKTPTTAPTSSSTTTSVPPPLTSVTYNAGLSGANGTSGEYPAPPGAPNGSGLAVISINASRGELCWKFSHLTIAASTVARMYRRTAGPGSWRYGFVLGRHYKPSGCVPKPLPTLRLIESAPQEWYVSIRSAQFPDGAVRAQA